jgi:hypothetical protein
MNDTKHNGWTNYATWRVNLEIFDGIDIVCTFGQHDDIYSLADHLKEYATDIIEYENPNGGLSKDYALAFLSDVNWIEIANFMTVGEGYFVEETEE